MAAAVVGLVQVLPVPLHLHDSSFTLEFSQLLRRVRQFLVLLIFAHLHTRIHHVLTVLFVDLFG
jgi:hypothetical protein